MHVLNIYAVHTQYIMKNRECYPIVLSSYKEYIANAYRLPNACRMLAEYNAKCMRNVCRMHTEYIFIRSAFGKESISTTYQIYIKIHIKYINNTT